MFFPETGHVQRREQRRSAVALIIMGQRPATSLLERQARLDAVKRLDLRRLMELNTTAWAGGGTSSSTMPRSFPAPGVFRQPKSPPAIGNEPMIVPDLPHGRGGHTIGPGYGAHRPMGGLSGPRDERQRDDGIGNFPVERRHAGRAGFVAEQAIGAFPRELRLPAPDTGLGAARRRHDGTRSQSIGGQKNDAGAPDTLMGAVLRSAAIALRR
jgi:hypothetical protein